MTSRKIVLNSRRPELSLEERRARRQERREKQRKANVGRASKMHVARVDFEGPPCMPEPPLCNVGCSGWFYWHWRGLFYPPNSATKDWFTQYASHFPTVELNAPFYSWPTVNAVKQWIKQADDRKFVYTVKACELLTHLKRFRSTKTLVKDFGFIADLLGAHMGCFLFQFPPGFHYTPARLESIVSQLDPKRRNVVEFRHRSWWNPTVYSAFKQSGIIFCSCSAPRLPDELIVTADEVYVRFHGPLKWYNHDYAPDELCSWVRKIDESGCRRVWAYFNNDRNAYAIKNAQEFAQQLKAIHRFKD